MKKQVLLAGILASYITASMMGAQLMVANAASCFDSAPPAASAGNAYLAVPASPILAHVPSVSGITVVQQYVSEQLKTHNLTAEQYLALPSDVQRKVMVPGRTTYLSREARHGIVAKKQSVPASITRGLSVNSTISQLILDQYGVPLPASVAIPVSANSGQQAKPLYRLIPICFNQLVLAINKGTLF
jgi:hypothetical protein